MRLVATDTTLIEKRSNCTFNQGHLVNRPIDRWKFMNQLRRKMEMPKEVISCVGVVSWPMGSEPLCCDKKPMDRGRTQATLKNGTTGWIPRHVLTKVIAAMNGSQRRFLRLVLL